MTKADKRENVIMIASEPLTFERSEWLEVKSNTMIVITPKVSCLPVLAVQGRRPELTYQMNVLQVPIIDEFWVAPQDPEASHRTQDFAIQMGFGELVEAQRRCVETLELIM
jgi:glutamine amidotransferase